MPSAFPYKPAVAAVLAALVISAPVSASSVVKEQLTVAPGHRMTSQGETRISSNAVKVLRHIAAARGELQDDKPDIEKAREHLRQTEKLLDVIQAALPTTRVKDHIWVAQKHLEYEDTHDVLPDLAPIYSGVDELVSYLPTNQARGHLDAAKQALQQGDKPEASERLEAANDALLYVEADLPLSSTRHLVAQAQTALAKGDAKAADQALVAAEDNVVFVSISFQSDLTQAKAALWRAQQDYDLGDKAYAKADLAQAVAYLQQAAKSGDEVARKAAENLVAEVRDLQALIDAGDQGFEARLESYWHRVKAISERSVEYLSTGWQRFRAEGAGKQELIEAKLQLAYARIDHFYAKNDAAAKVELAEAKGYLDAAARRSGDASREKLAYIAGQLEGLEKNLASSGKETFEQAEAQLSALIRQL